MHPKFDFTKRNQDNIEMNKVVFVQLFILQFCFECCVVPNFRIVGQLDPGLFRKGKKSFVK